MKNQDTRNKLIETVKRLLTSGEEPESITARQICAQAETNLAMINYCFKSKDELVKIAVDEIVQEEFQKYSSTEQSEKTAKERLKEVLLHVSTAMVKYKSLTRLSIPYLMLNEDITLPFDILPFIKNHYGSRKNETECRFIAFQMVYTMQLIFYRADDFAKYSGIKIENQQQLEDLLDLEINLLLN